MKLNKGLIVFCFIVWSLGCSQNSNPIRQSNTFNLSTQSHLIDGYYEPDTQIKDAILKVTFKTSEAWKFCTGVNIGHGLVLTAAHCHKDLLDRSDFFNSYTLFSNEKVQLTNTSQSFLMFEYPFQYDTRVKYSNDLSLLKPEQFKEPATSFELPSENDPLPDQLYLSGYGFRIYKEKGITLEKAKDFQLKSLSVKKSQLISHFNISPICGLDQTQCKSVLGAANKDIQEGNLLCFKSDSNNPGSPYYGDSGGPLYSKNTHGKLVLHGIFSIFVFDTNGKNSVFCYTSVVKYLA